ncbi:MAG: DUF4435 domain-containing protein [Sulfurimonas sp.]|nr:DUF4435 domain-containing protein [Sulfurimonas sp.]
MEVNSLQTAANQLDSKLSEIRLSISHPSNKNKVFILLEGNTDIKLFRKFFVKDYADTTGLVGKEKVIKALEILIAEGYTQIIGIKDADFDHLLNTQTVHNLFITDFHDMEIQMIESPALDSVIAEYGKADARTIDIKEKTYAAVLTIGYARYFNEKKKYAGEERDLSFDSLKFQNFIQLKDEQLLFDEVNFLFELISESKKRKPNLQIAEQQLKNEIESSEAESYDIRQVCSGHDMTKVLGLVLLKNPDGNEIEKALRLAYSLQYFQQTSLYSQLQSWATSNIKRLF